MTDFLAGDPFKGVRSWRIITDTDGYLLASVFQKNNGKHIVWPPREKVEAFCVRWPQHHVPPAFLMWGTIPKQPEHDSMLVPYPDCQCGLYARKHDEPYTRWGAGLKQLADGEVFLWGRVIEGERGYRAQYAYPGSLVVRGVDAEPAAESLKERYGVEVFAL